MHHERCNTWKFSACVYPLAQLLPAPPPWGDKKMFSWLYSWRWSEFWMEFITLGSRSSICVQIVNHTAVYTQHGLLKARSHAHARRHDMYTYACVRGERERERSNLPGPAVYSAGRLPGRRIRPFGHQQTQHRGRCRPWRYHAPSIAVKYSIQWFLNSNQKNSNLIPKFSADLISTLANLQSDDLSELISKYISLTREERTYRGIVLAPSTMVVCESDPQESVLRGALFSPVRVVQLLSTAMKGS